MIAALLEQATWVIAKALIVCMIFLFILCMLCIRSINSELSYRIGRFTIFVLFMTGSLMILIILADVIYTIWAALG